MFIFGKVTSFINVDGEEFILLISIDGYLAVKVLLDFDRVGDS